MRIITPTASALQEAVDALREGKIVVHPTETCYGIACDLRSREAVERLFRIKKRPTDKPISGLFATTDEVLKWVVQNEQGAALFQELPGPLTVILPLRENAGIYPTPSGGETLGVRVSSLPLAQQLAAIAGFPISTTSANIHGEANPYSAEDIATRFEKEEYRPDLILDAGILPPTPPSRVVDATTALQKELRAR